MSGVAIAQEAVVLPVLAALVRPALAVAVATVQPKLMEVVVQPVPMVVVVLAAPLGALCLFYSLEACSVKSNSLNDQLIHQIS